MSSAKDSLIKPRLDSSGQYNSSLLLLKTRSLLNSFARGSKSGALFILLLVILVVWGEVAGTLRAVDFLIHFDTIKVGPNIGLIILQRLLEGAFIVLSAGVAFSAITTALSTLYLSDDLNFLLAQPISAVRVFSQKLLETFLSSAGLAALLTLPAVLALGAAFAAPWWFYPLSIWLTLIVYALPVGFGAMIAVFLMRFAPAGKVREIATGIGVILSAGLIYFVRALKPEDLLKLISNPNLSSEQAVKLGEQFNKLLEQYAGSQDTLMPPALAARALWSASQGEFSTAILGLSIVGVVSLLVAGWLAALAYREGWVRGLEGTLSKLNTKVLTASAGERFFARFGQMGHILYRDIRLLFRDATQWSQLLILVALVGVYLISIRAYPLEGLLGTPKFRNVVGYLQLAFQSFVIAGIGIRVAFPAVSLEGYGYWILRTGPINIRDLVLWKYFAALPPMLIITVIMAVQSSNLLQTSPMIRSITLMVGISSALVITALGVGLGAAFPRFKADNPSEIPMSPGGLLYMLLSLAFATLLALLMAVPAFFTITMQESFNTATQLSYWLHDGLWILLVYLAATVVGVIWPLTHGINKLSVHEQP
jgi:ABC-2 type transport system permease protein